MLHSVQFRPAEFVADTPICTMRKIRMIWTIGKALLNVFVKPRTPRGHSPAVTEDTTHLSKSLGSQNRSIDRSG